MLTHPANWGPFRRELFEEVPQVAGLTAPRMVTEPEAAAAHYAASRHAGRRRDHRRVRPGRRHLRRHGAAQARRTASRSSGSPRGSSGSAASTSTRRSSSHVNYAAGGALTELDMSDPQTASPWPGCARTACWPRRRSRSTPRPRSRCSCPTGTSTSRLTRAELRGHDPGPDRVDDRHPRPARCARRRSTRSQLSAVLLVGGSSRIPLVARMISEELGRPTVVDAHPKYAVALGAAVLAEARRRKAPAMLLTGADAGRTAEGSVVGDLYRPAVSASTEASRVSRRVRRTAPRERSSVGGAAAAGPVTGPGGGATARRSGAWTVEPGAGAPHRREPPGTVHPAATPAAGGAAGPDPRTGGSRLRRCSSSGWCCWWSSAAWSATWPAGRTASSAGGACPAASARGAPAPRPGHDRRRRCRSRRSVRRSTSGRPRASSSPHRAVGSSTSPTGTPAWSPSSTRPWTR